MTESTDAAELEAYGNIDITEGMYEYLMLEGIGIVISFIAFALIIIATIKINKRTNIPGSRLIALSVVLTALFALLSASYSAIFGIEKSATIDAIINIALSLLFFVGSLGFVRLCKYASNHCANN